jgi:hypothetical protein
MKSCQKRLRAIELSLTPQQVVVVWLRNVLQAGTCEDAVRRTPLPRVAVANAVYSTVRNSMKGQDDSPIERAVLQARQEADLLYNLVVMANVEVLENRTQRKREYVFLLGYLSAEMNWKVTKDRVEYLRLAFLMFIETVIILDAAIVQVAGERLSGQPVLFRDSAVELAEQLQMARTRVMNQLQAVALNEGLRCKKRLWRDAGREQLESFALAPWASRRRRDLLELLDQLTPTIAELTQAIEQEVEKCPEAQRLQTHPGVGALTALAFVLIIGRADRFQCGKQIASYLGLVPMEESSGQRRRLGHITKQGNSLLRFLLVEAAQVTVRSDQEWRSKYFHLAMRRGRKIAKVAMARRLAVRMYWMWRKGWNYEQMKKFGSHAGEPGHRQGVQ